MGLCPEHAGRLLLAWPHAAFFKCGLHQECDNSFGEGGDVPQGLPVPRPAGGRSTGACGPQGVVQDD